MNIIKIKTVSIGAITFPSYGYVAVDGYKPSYSGYTLVDCSIYSYSEFVSGTAGAIMLQADGNYITGPANSKATNIYLRYVFVKTELLSIA